MPPLITYFATNYKFAVHDPMLIGAYVEAGCWTLGLVFGPETKGTVMVPDLVVA